MYRSCYLIIHVKRITQKYVDFSFMCSFLVLLSLEIHTIYCVVIVLATFYDVCSVEVRAVTSTTTSVWFVSSLFSNGYYTETIIIQQLIPLPTFI